MYVDPNGSKAGTALSPRKEQSFLTSHQNYDMDFSLKVACNRRYHFFAFRLNFEFFSRTKNLSILNFTKADKLKTVQTALISEFK